MQNRRARYALIRENTGKLPLRFFPDLLRVALHLQFIATRLRILIGTDPAISTDPELLFSPSGIRSFFAGMI